MPLPLHRALAELDLQGDVASALQTLVNRGLDQLPLPGHGQTLQRWQALAAVAEHDLSLAKLYEGHTDALAILQELSQPLLAQPRSTWGVWAAEAAGERVLMRPAEEGGVGRVALSGLKRWCSGAVSVSHGLLTAWHADGRGPQLVAVAMRQTGVQVHTDAWQAVGMGGSASVDVAFDAARAEPVGQPGEYLSRPGFWHGGAGIAACWHGGASALASVLRRTVAQGQSMSAKPAAPSFREAALGRIDTELAATAALLREAAHAIDAHPGADAQALALRVRLRAESTAKAVLDGVGTALGATPFCRDARFARMAADLPVFIRQSHGERDFAALGEHVAAASAASTGWAL